MEQRTEVRRYIGLLLGHSGRGCREHAYSKNDHFCSKTLLLKLTNPLIRTRELEIKGQSGRLHRKGRKLVNQAEFGGQEGNWGDNVQNV